jgi:hypothetical protein
MAEKLITCSECQGMFDVGHIPPGREMKCPSCGNSLIVPGEEQPVPVEPRPRTVVAGSSPRQATAGGSSPRQATASGSRIGTISKRSNPLMRRVKAARPGGGTVVRGAQGGEGQSLSSGRHPAAVQKKGANVALIIGIAVVVLGGGGAWYATRGRNEKVKPPASEGAPVAKAVPGPKPAPGGTKPAAANPGAPATAAAPGAAAKPDEFKAGSESVKVEGWTVDPVLLAEVEMKLRASWDKKGDPDIRKGFVALSEKYFPVIVDRLRSDNEGVVREAAAVANEMLKKYDIWFGKRGEDPVNTTLLFDPEYRMQSFKDLRAACDQVLKKSAAGGGTASTGGDAGASALNQVVVDALRRGGQDREELIEKMKAKPSQHVPELIKQLEAVGEDKLGGRAVASALNELTNANLPIPAMAEYDGAAMKKKWEDWLKENAGKLK